MGNHQEDYDASETFTESSVIGAVKRALQIIHPDDIVAHVHTEWDRKGLTEAGALDSKSSLRNESDDIIVSLEFRISAWAAGQLKLDKEEIATAVKDALETRSSQEEIAANKARRAAIVLLEAEIEAIKATINQE